MRQSHLQANCKNREKYGQMGQVFTEITAFGGAGWEIAPEFNPEY